jgi:tetratricopeptide (TPR) repeat protein
MMCRVSGIKLIIPVVLILAVLVFPASASNLAKGQKAFFKSDYTSAITYFSRALKERPDNAMVLFFLGQSYFNLKKYKEAKTYFLNALQIKPDYVLARLNLARTCDALGDRKSALKEYLIVEKDHPKELKASDKKRIVTLSKAIELPQDPKVSGRKLSATDSDPPKIVVIEPRISRGISRVEEDEKIIEDARYFAVLIAVAEYDDPSVYDLDQPVLDIRSLKKILSEKYTFDPARIELLENPSRRQIINTFYDLRKNITTEDNLLIFYAGHGHWDEEGEIGYWLPSDAQEDDRTNWISNSTIRDFIRFIKSRHTLMIADACFSGSIFKTRKAFDRSNVAVEELYKLPSRKAITSGTLTEVPDKSVFVDFFLKRLADNEKKYATSQVIFANLRTAVINNSITKQIPQYGTIYGCGDEGGDFIFIRRTQK